MLCIIWVSADYGIYHNADFDLCGTVFECASKLRFMGLPDYICSRIMASALGNAYFSNLSDTVITFKGISL